MKRYSLYLVALLASVVSIGHLVREWIIMRTRERLGGVDSMETVKDSFALARQHSFGFFNDITDMQWKLMQQNARSESLFQHSTSPEDGALWLLNNADPIFSCMHLKRILGRGDGPKWVCDPHRLNENEDCLIYSIGSKGKYEFEDGIVSYLGGPKCEIHVFDPNPKYAREGDPEKKNIHYHAWGLGSSYNSQTSMYKSIFEIVEELGHEGRRIDILKIDCDGCEWETYKDWLDPKIDVRQLLVEIHAAKQKGNKLIRFFIDFLGRGFLPFSKEANTKPKNLRCGSFFEYGFIRLDTSFLGNEMGSIMAHK